MSLVCSIVVHVRDQDTERERERERVCTWYMYTLYLNSFVNQIIAEDFLDNKMSVKEFVQGYKQERVVSPSGMYMY